MEKQSSTINIPTSIIIAGLIIAGAIIFSKGGGTSPKPVEETPEPAAIAADIDVAKVKNAGEPFMGALNAPLTIAYWYDYQCSYCKQNEANAIRNIVKEYVDSGKVKIIFKDFQFLGPNSYTLGKYSQAVWEAAPAKFYDWHKAVFEAQNTSGDWASETKIGLMLSRILGQESAKKVTDLVKSKGDEYERAMDSDKTEGASFGIKGTPALIIGAELIPGALPYGQIKAAIESELAKK